MPGTHLSSNRIKRWWKQGWVCTQPLAQRAHALFYTQHCKKASQPTGQPTKTPKARKPETQTGVNCNHARRSKAGVLGASFYQDNSEGQDLGEKTFLEGMRFKLWDEFIFGMCQQRRAVRNIPAQRLAHSPVTVTERLREDRIELRCISSVATARLQLIQRTEE